MAYDLFFLSYQEPTADDLWQNLKERFPHAKRVDGVEGILNAHKECARRSNTSHFFVVDADSEILDFDFTFKVSPYEADYVHLWYATNMVNGLEYGWGGLKLFPKKVFRGMDTLSGDMTTSFALKVIPEVVSRTHFNITPYDAWRSGFREGAKLYVQGNEESQERLVTWCNIGESALNGKFCIDGAKAGVEYAKANPTLPDINNWLWLKEQFEQTYK